MTERKRYNILEISSGADAVQVVVDANTDLDNPFYGYPMNSTDRLYFSTPWALDIEVVCGVLGKDEIEHHTTTIFGEAK